MKMTTSNKAFLFYQSIGLIPLEAKRSDGNLHHLDPSLKKRDPERYKQYNIYDVIPIPNSFHHAIHAHWDKKGKDPGNKGKTGCYSEETIKKMSESAKKKPPVKESTRKKQSEVRKGKHWKNVDGRRVWYD